MVLREEGPLFPPSTSNLCLFINLRTLLRQWTPAIPSLSITSALFPVQRRGRVSSLTLSLATRLLRLPRVATRGASRRHLRSLHPASTAGTALATALANPLLYFQSFAGCSSRNSFHFMILHCCPEVGVRPPLPLVAGKGILELTIRRGMVILRERREVEGSLRLHSHARGLFRSSVTVNCQLWADSSLWSSTANGELSTADGLNSLFRRRIWLAGTGANNLCRRSWSRCRTC